MRLLARCTLFGVVVVTLALTSPDPSRLLALSTTGAGLDAALQPLLALLGLLAWAGAAWLLVVAGLVQAGALPGQLGRCCRWAARRSAPATVRQALRLALGLALVTGTAATLVGPASASTLPTPYGPVPTLDWPGSDHSTAIAQPVAREATARAATRPGEHLAPHVAPASETTQPVVVAPGDTLWDLARSELGPHASTARVAQAWPRWWHANRQVIGDDPSRLTPGERLAPPA